MMTEEESRKWRPEIGGWSDDILPFYRDIAPELPNPCTVVELGTAQGRSAMFLDEVLVALGHRDRSAIWCVDSWEDAPMRLGFYGHLFHLGTEEKASLLRPVRARTDHAHRLFEDGSIDLLFVDADHSEAGVLKDLALWAPKIAPGGILAGHDFDEREFPGVVSAVRKFWHERGWGPVNRATRSVFCRRVI